MTTDKMLIDAAHPEETRVVVLRGNRIEEFDYESAAKKLLRGNIYLAKITRVEPSLQAAFVDYGGNRHGFLAFSEIHPDYYQIPVADRQALLREEAEAVAEEARREASETDSHPEHDNHDDEPDGPESGPTEIEEAGGGSVPWDIEDPVPAPLTNETPEADPSGAIAAERSEPALHGSLAVADLLQSTQVASEETPLAADDQPSHANGDAGHDHNGPSNEGETPVQAHAEEPPATEYAPEETPERKRRPRRAQYKIQEVIKRRQIILVQVVKEERGNKGAALTTYLSLAGRYTVLMPNTARGGGISRKITNAVDRRRLKEITSELEVPQGMGLIVRTAGASRNTAEIKRDHDYLLRLWESVRDLTLKSSAPALVYEEGSLVKRSIRDLYSKEIEEVVVAGNEAYESARDFMRMLMPSHAKNVKSYDEAEPLFARYQIERQLNAMYSPYVTLKSGGYIVLNQTEALVAIDVNSGKSTREHSIEDTALNTNLEASDEIARQLRLRDLAGLIVIDFIDMDERRNNRAVERRLKDALRHDRARIQVGRISHFGLMEMSRQRLRTGVLEGSTSQCPHCMGTGVIRSTESVALAVLRALEDNLMGHPPRNMVATTSIEVALYLLNEKRSYLRDIEGRYGVAIEVDADASLQGANFRIDATGAATGVVLPARPRDAVQLESGFDGEEEEVASTAEPAEEAAQGEEAEEAVGETGDRKRSRRRRRRRGERQERGPENRNGEVRADAAGDGQPNAIESIGESGIATDDDLGGEGEEAEEEAGDGSGLSVEGRAAEGDRGERRGRRRGRRGGRRNRRGGREGMEVGIGEAQGAPESQSNGAETYPAWRQQPYDVAYEPRPASAPTGDFSGAAEQLGGTNGGGVQGETPRAAQPELVNEASGRDFTKFEIAVPARHEDAASAVGSAFRHVRAPESGQTASNEPAAVPMAKPAPDQIPSSLDKQPAAEASDGVQATSEPAGPPKRGWWSKRFSGG